MSQHVAAILLQQRDFRIIRGIANAGREVLVERGIDAATAGGQRLVPRNREQPGRHRGARLEGSGLAPDDEKDLAEQILGQGLVGHEAAKPPVNRRLMAGKKGSHGELIALRDPDNQSLVGGGLVGRPQTSARQPTSCRKELQTC